MKMTIREVFDLMCKFKTYPELDMNVTLKYGVDFLHIFKNVAKVLGYNINEFEIDLDLNYMKECFIQLCDLYFEKVNGSILPEYLNFEI